MHAEAAAAPCFRDLLVNLYPHLLENALRSWDVDELQCSLDDETLQGVSIDGQTMCGTLRPFAAAVHLLSAVDHRTGQVLQQCHESDHTNEHKATWDFLKRLCTQGRLVVGDAIFCQRELCQQMLDSGGDYLVAVKDNQPGLLREIALEFTAAPAVFSPMHLAGMRSRTANVHRGQQGARPSGTPDPDLHRRAPLPSRLARRSAGLPRRTTINPERQNHDRNSVLHHRAATPAAHAAQRAKIFRDHGGRIENGGHGVRDVVFDEDRCTIQRGHSPQNGATARNVALNFLHTLKTDNLAATISSFIRYSFRLFSLLGCVK